MLINKINKKQNPLPSHPENIEEITEDLALHYISNPTTIILAISTGTVEIANSYSLALARRVDPEGSRTLGVFTFLDKVDNKGQMVNYLK